MVLCYVPGFCAAPWGALPNYVNEAEPAKTGEKYLLRKILEGQPIAVGLDPYKYTSDKYGGSTIEQYTFAEQDTQGEAIYDAYNEWFFNAVRHIEKAQREDEFADILPILRKGVEMIIGGKDNDIEFSFMPLQSIQLHCRSGAGGCYVPGLSGPSKMPARIYLPNKDVFLKARQKNLSLHEIGHSLGLSDQYIQARSVNSDPRYGSSEERDSVMKKAGWTKGLSCDDADGIINLIDITRGIRRGGETGWKTLCPHSKEYYIGGTSASKGPYRMRFDEPFDFVTLDSYDPDGKVIKTQSFPLGTLAEETPWEEGAAQIVQRDSFGRPVLAQGADGETVYYDYIYDRVQRLTVKDGRALRFVREYYYPKHGPDHLAAVKEMVFIQNGYLSIAKVKISTRHICTGEYAELKEKSAVRASERVYDSGGRLVKSFYWDEQEEQEDKTEPVPVVQKSGSVVSKSRKKDLARSIEQTVKSAQRQRLEEQLDAWTQKTWKDFMGACKKSNWGKNEQNINLKEKGGPSVL